MKHKKKFEKKKSQEKKTGRTTGPGVITPISGGGRLQHEKKSVSKSQEFSKRRRVPVDPLLPQPKIIRNSAEKVIRPLVNPKRAKGESPRKDFKQNKRIENKSVVEEELSLLHLKATVDKNRKGFSFLIFEKRSVPDAFVPPDRSESLFHGDRVQVLFRPPNQVLKIQVLEHRIREAVGRFSPHPRGWQSGGWLIYEKKKAREEIFIPFVPKFLPKDQDWIRASLEFHTKGQHPVTGTLLEVFGPNLPPSADLPMVAADYNLIEMHSEGAVREALSKKLAVPGKDLEGRQDLRKIPFITIDGATARDFDDAVFVESSRTGYTLWVAIADVSHYVQEGSELDREARSRGTSVYFPERAFHMLPGALSENLCSLRPNEPRLALVAKMEFNQDGKRLKTEVIEAVIESQRRATYEQIQAEWEAERNNLKWAFLPHFELYRVLKKVRSERGSLDFEFPEAELSVKPTGEVISIMIRPRQDSHRLIEEFMIVANESVTEWMIEKKWPFVYRIHEEPSMQSLENFQALAATVGMQVSLEKARSPKILADLVRKLDGHPAQTLLSMSLLRSMKQAMYSSTHGIHFGLASEGYTHFTSPIRRYPDLVVHRLLRLALRHEQSGQTLKKQLRDQLEKDLVDICEHCSYRERLATDAERDSIKLKQVRVMLEHLGSEFDGKIVGMVNSGLFVQIPNPYVEGMISADSMTDDFYEFHEERMVFSGRKKRRTFKIGDPLKICVAKADLDRRQIEFVIVEPRGKKDEVD